MHGRAHCRKRAGRGDAPGSCVQSRPAAQAGEPHGAGAFDGGRRGGETARKLHSSIIRHCRVRWGRKGARRSRRPLPGARRRAITDLSRGAVMDRYLVVSSDCHAGLPPERYRDYLDPAYHKTFDLALPVQVEMTKLMERQFLVADVNREWRRRHGGKERLQRPPARVHAAQSRVRKRLGLFRTRPERKACRVHAASRGPGRKRLFCKPDHLLLPRSLSRRGSYRPVTRSTRAALGRQDRTYWAQRVRGDGTGWPKPWPVDRTRRADCQGRRGRSGWISERPHSALVS